MPVLSDYPSLKFADEGAVVESLAAANPLSAQAASRAQSRASRIVEAVRADRGRRSMVDAFLQEYGLETDEGLALMELAECLLRIPDTDTVDALLTEKIGGGDWSLHRGHSASAAVNAGTRALALAQEMLSRSGEETFAAVAARLGEPVMRLAVRSAMRVVGDAFVYAPTIEEALDKARDQRPGAQSFDMLGEAARTEADASRYFDNYAAAIEAVGQSGEWTDVRYAPGVSVKLSALCPRYEYTQREHVHGHLYQALLALARRAAAQGIGLTIDAEEADRLTLSLELLERLCGEPSLADWKGLGLAVQAYQKRAPAVIDRLTAMARNSGRRLMVRLVKGAYWDTEIKRAQVAGLPGYPVFTRKVATDACYLVCAARMLDTPDALFPQFATHNAFSLAALIEMAGERDFELQRLHGMGEPLFEQLEEELGRELFVRTYAPVGAYRDLLPYLVRRLLENGANSSFVHHLFDEKASVESLVENPFEDLRALPESPIAPPSRLYSDRRNSRGRDLAEPDSWQALLAAESAAAARQWSAPAIVGGRDAGSPEQSVVSPQVPSRVIGHWAEAGEEAIETAFTAAQGAQPEWNRRGGGERAAVLDAFADRLEERAEEFCSLLLREAGRSWPDAIAEVREAADFCRYYALQARRLFAVPTLLEGPTGERNEMGLQGRGVVVCISPWNFPLAIFTGQVAGALAAGNAVLAKPAEQTPLVAAHAVRLMHEAGVPAGVLHLLPGGGETVGARLVEDARVAAVAFTGSTATANAIHRALARSGGAIAPLIAETGGLNAMVVDSTALPEQVADAVVKSAFHSAGQRCSALRLLLLPDATADAVLTMIAGACDALVLGDTVDPAVDVGPIIDAGALRDLQAWLEGCERREGWSVMYRYPAERVPGEGSFCAPAIVQVPDSGALGREVFGPILHVVRYRPGTLDRELAALRGQGYGLTLGIQSRLEGFAERVRRALPVGNTYINRDMVGAVVGVQPFGGHGLSGTGPKAGGPHYLPAFATEWVRTENTAASGGDVELYRKNTF